MTPVKTGQTSKPSTITKSAQKEEARGSKRHRKDEDGSPSRKESRRAARTPAKEQRTPKAKTRNKPRPRYG
jgi:hypothetical protein